MAIADDISIAANGDIRYTGTAHGASGAGYYTVIEFHRYLQDRADDAVASGDDLLDITDDTPSERSTDNIITLLSPYNIDDTLSEHLYDGSIIQAGGDTIYDGIVNYGTEGIHIEVIQNGAIVANDFWNTVPFGETEKGLNRDVAGGISHRFMIKVRTSAADIDGRRLLGINREFGMTYGEFKIVGTARGNNVFALTHSTDLNNATAEATVATWTTITNVEGYAAIDVNNDATDEYFYSEWNRDTYTINQFYERMKWLTRRGSVSTLYGIDAGIFRGITSELSGTQASGTFVEPESVSWTGGTGQLLACNSTSAATKLWIQVLTGIAPTSGTVTGNGGATFTVSGSADKPVSLPFCGASTGSALIGAYGFGIEYADLSNADLLTALDGNTYQPPNNVTFYVYGLVSGEDRVLVGPESGGALLESQLTVDGTYSGGETTFTVNEAIPGDTPNSGTIRVWNGDTFSRVTYTGWSGSSFTGCANVPACTEGDDVFISYIDELASGTSASFTGVYQSSRSLFIRVRDGGASPIKTFETTGTLGSAGGSTTAIRTSDA
jgi:hypothetical protein